MMVGDKYEIWECLLSLLEGCLLYITDAAEFAKVLSPMASKILGDALYAKVKSTTPKICGGGVARRTPFFGMLQQLER